MRIFELIKKNEYEIEYDLNKLKQFSEPKIYTGNDDLSKRWYVYFSYRNSTTGKLERQAPIYGEANKLKTKTDRLAYLATIRKVLHQMLKKGYSPFEDAEVTDERLIAEATKNQTTKRVESQSQTYTVKQAMEFISTCRPSHIACPYFLSEDKIETMQRYLIFVNDFNAKIPKLNKEIKLYNERVREFINENKLQAHAFTTASNFTKQKTNGIVNKFLSTKDYNALVEKLNTDTMLLLYKEK